MIAAFAVLGGLATPVVAAPAKTKAAVPARTQAAATSPTTMPPPFLNLPALLPPLGAPARPDTAPECRSGASTCLATTIAKMTQQLDALASSCDEGAVFSLAYLRTTQTYEWARDQAGYFADTPWVNHEDSVFAAYYFRAYDRYAAGQAVPEAWQVAFDASKHHQVTGYGSVLLGMNAHINRDLPFVLASIGITKPDGTSRKADHDKVNEFLNAEVNPLFDEIGARFDPSVQSLGAGTAALFQVLAGWREMAWRNAELLTSAPNAAARQVVADEIEASSALEARTILATTSYLPPLSSSAGRDAFCAAHHGDPAPSAYPFGMPTN